jgi:hypothetical protein
MNPLKLEYRSVEALIPYARNAKQHPDGQVAQIAASIREFGWGAPILVDGNNNVIASWLHANLGWLRCLLSPWTTSRTRSVGP